MTRAIAWLVAVSDARADAQPATPMLGEHAGEGGKQPE